MLRLMTSNSTMYYPNDAQGWTLKDYMYVTYGHIQCNNPSIPSWTRCTVPRCRRVMVPYTAGAGSWFRGHNPPMKRNHSTWPTLSSCRLDLQEKAIYRVAPKRNTWSWECQYIMQFFLHCNENLYGSTWVRARQVLQDSVLFVISFWYTFFVKCSKSDPIQNVRQLYRTTSFFFSLPLPLLPFSGPPT